MDRADLEGLDPIQGDKKYRSSDDTITDASGRLQAGRTEHRASQQYEYRDVHRRPPN
jgi:hypothetical protein